jgi:hypothetical protein
MVLRDTHKLINHRSTSIAEGKEGKEREGARIFNACGNRVFNTSCFAEREKGISQWPYLGICRN